MDQNASCKLGKIADGANAAAGDLLRRLLGVGVAARTAVITGMQANFGPWRLLGGLFGGVPACCFAYFGPNHNLL